MTRIARAFGQAATEGQVVLAPFITVGFPDLDTSIELAGAYAEAGANMLEIGFPFSDPIADGPTVQRASQQALDQGTTLADALSAVRRIRTGTDIPLLLMGYANPFLQYGYDAIAQDLAAAGGDGVIVPDVLPEDAGDIERACAAAAVASIRFAAPTTPAARLQTIGQGARGFIYCVSVTGVTGSRAELSDRLPTYLARVRQATTLPRVVGFGISTPDHVRALQGVAEGAIVASALIDIIDNSAPADAVGNAAARVRELAVAACNG